MRQQLQIKSYLDRTGHRQAATWEADRRIFSARAILPHENHKVERMGGCALNPGSGMASTFERARQGLLLDDHPLLTHGLHWA